MITTTVTWADLKDSPREELSDLEDAREELVEQVTDEYGEGALSETLPQDPDNVADDRRKLWVYQQQLQRFEQAKQSIENRLNFLGLMADEYPEGEFELKMLTGNETMAVETELKMLAQQKDVSLDTIYHRRNVLVADKATVDAPEGFPTDADGSPKPSDAPNNLVLSLWEQINRLNNAGQVDFRPEGFGEFDTAVPTAGQSASPTPSDMQ
jgi:hypothetical protein